MSGAFDAARRAMLDRITEFTSLDQTSSRRHGTAADDEASADGSPRRDRFHRHGFRDAHREHLASQANASEHAIQALAAALGHVANSKTCQIYVKYSKRSDQNVNIQKDDN